MNILNRIKSLWNRSSTEINGWKYNYVPVGKAVEVTITNPEGRALRPVLMPRAGYDWFKHE